MKTAKPDSTITQILRTIRVEDLANVTGGERKIVDTPQHVKEARLKNKR